MRQNNAALDTQCAGIAHPYIITTLDKPAAL